MEEAEDDVIKRLEQDADCIKVGAVVVGVDVVVVGEGWEDNVVVKLLVVVVVVVEQFEFELTVSGEWEDVVCWMLLLVRLVG